MLVFFRNVLTERIAEWKLHLCVSVCAFDGWSQRGETVLLPHFYLQRCWLLSLQTWHGQSGQQPWAGGIRPWPALFRPGSLFNLSGRRGWRCTCKGKEMLVKQGESAPASSRLLCAQASSALSPPTAGGDHTCARMVGSLRVIARQTYTSKSGHIIVTKICNISSK